MMCIQQIIPQQYTNGYLRVLKHDFLPTIFLQTVKDESNFIAVLINPPLPKPTLR